MLKDLLRNLLSFFNTQLARAFDKLRVSSPLIYAIVLGVVFGLGEMIRTYIIGLETVPEWVEYIIIIIEAITAVGVSTRTKRHMPEEVAKVKAMATTDMYALRDYDD